VVQPDIVDVERNMNDHIWKMTPLGMLLLLLLLCEKQLLVRGRPLYLQLMISSYLSSLQRIQEEVVQPDIAVVGLIERNMHDLTVHEIVEHEFQDLELAKIYLIVGPMLGYRNQNSRHPPI
jgi:hypothetical protein